MNGDLVVLHLFLTKQDTVGGYYEGFCGVKCCYGSGRILPSTEQTEGTDNNHICIFTKNSVITQYV